MSTRDIETLSAVRAKIVETFGALGLSFSRIIESDDEEKPGYLVFVDGYVEVANVEVRTDLEEEQLQFA